ncbi:MAG: phasin family protein [Steroidobacteraceae bacterium]
MTTPPNPFTDMLKALEQFNMPGMLPGLDMQKLLDARRKDIEALTEANRIAFESMQTLAQKQADILRRSLEQLQSNTQQAMTGGNAMASAAKQSELAQKALQQAMENVREITEAGHKAQTQAFEVITKRIQENMAEMLTLFQRK